MFVKLPTPKGDYCVNLLKVLFFYAHKDLTRFEMDDGTIIDFNVKMDELLEILDGYGCDVISAVKELKN